MKTTRHPESKPNGLELNLINPKKHGEKFSPNLHRWLKKHRSCAMFATLWKDSKDGTLWIGWFDDTGCFIGNRAYQALAEGKKLCYAWSDGMENLVEVPNFWENYLKVGRCAIDPEHTSCFSSAGGERWKTHSDSHRECQWCGLHQQKRDRKVTVIRSEWVAQP